MAPDALAEDGIVEGEFVAKGAPFRSLVHYGWQNENDTADVMVLDQLVAERRNAATAEGREFKKLKVLTVVGGCDTTLGLLARGDVVESLDVGDINEAQVEMLYLKLAAAVHCPGGTPGICEFLGLGNEDDPTQHTSEIGERRKELYKEYVRPGLPQEYQKAWDSRLDEDIAYGPCAAADASTVYASMRATLASKGFTQEDILGGKLAHIVAELDGSNDKEGLAKLRRSLIECLPFSMIGCAHQYNKEPFWPAMKENIGCAFGSFLVDVLFWWWRKEAASGQFGELAKRNVVMSMAFSGNLPPSDTYQWLKEENLKSFREGRSAKLTPHIGDILETAQRLSKESGRKFDLITISNIPDRSPVDKLRPYMEQLRSSLAPGGYILSRRFTGQQDALFEGLMELPSELNKELVLKAPGFAARPFSLVASTTQH